MVQIHSSVFRQRDPEAPRGRILLVDDDPGLLRLLSIRLRAEGYDVEAVESANAALGILPVTFLGAAICFYIASRTIG